MEEKGVTAGVGALNFGGFLVCWSPVLFLDDSTELVEVCSIRSSESGRQDTG